MGKTSNQGKRPAEKSIGPFAGGIGVAVWVNTVETQRGSRPMRSITINPRRLGRRPSKRQMMRRREMLG